MMIRKAGRITQCSKRNVRGCQDRVSRRSSRYSRSIDREAIGQAGMIHSGGRSSVY